MVTGEATSSSTGKKSWSTGEIERRAGRIPQVATKLHLQDRLSTIKVELDCSECIIRLSPDCIAVGRPTPNRPSSFPLIINFPSTICAVN